MYLLPNNLIQSHHGDLKAHLFLRLSRFHPQNVLGIRQFADTLGHSELTSCADKFVLQFFRDVSVSEEFLGLDVRDVVELVRKDELHVHTEEVVFEAVLRWTRCDDARRQHLPLLLSHVRMPLLSPQYLTDRVAKEECIRSCHECR